MERIAGIELEDCFTKPTQAQAEALNARIEKHNEAVADHAEKAASFATQNIDAIDVDELYNPTYQRDAFALRRAELEIRRELAQLFTARAADRRTRCDELFPEIAAAEAAALKAIHKAGWTAGDGKVWDQTAIGNVHPASFRSHPKIVAAHAAHQNAQAIAHSFHDAQVNNQKVIDLEKALHRMRAAATAA